MKKLTISFLVGLFLTSNAFAAIILPSMPESPRISKILKVNSNSWAELGEYNAHDRAPNYLSNDNYEIKFDTPATCLGRIC